MLHRSARPRRGRAGAIVLAGAARQGAGRCRRLPACHTKDESKPFAGGRAIETPFGTIYSPNITPDRDTGIGAWSDEEFYQALHDGIGPDGTRLYPAFPYPYFTKMPRDDVMAVRAYLNTLQPIASTRPDNKLTWPLNHRVFMSGWNRLFFTPGTFTPDPARSAEWNRGAYLVEGPGHCGACHTPKNALGGDKSGEALRGGQLQDWFVPNISNDSRNGLGAWSADEIVEYLKTGRNAKSGASALMSEVVTHSTAKMSDADLHAIATYLKSMPGTAERQAVAAPDRAVMDAGKAIYLDSCSACHQLRRRRRGAHVPAARPQRQRPVGRSHHGAADDPAGRPHRGDGSETHALLDAGLWLEARRCPGGGGRDLCAQRLGQHGAGGERRTGGIAQDPADRGYAIISLRSDQSAPKHARRAFSGAIGFMLAPCLALGVRRIVAYFHRPT